MLKSHYMTILIQKNDFSSLKTTLSIHINYTNKILAKKTLKLLVGLNVTNLHPKHMEVNMYIDTLTMLHSKPYFNQYPSMCVKI